MDAVLPAFAVIGVAVTLLSVVAWVASGALHRQPALRHCVLLSGLLCTLATPVVVAVFGLLGIGVWRLPLFSSANPDSTANSKALASLREFAPTAETPPGPASLQEWLLGRLRGKAHPAEETGREGILPDDMATLPATSADSIHDVKSRLSRFGRWLTVVWATGTGVLAMGFLRSLLSLRRLLRGQCPATDQMLQQVFKDVRRHLNCAPLPPIVVAPGAKTIMAVGLFRPMIVLPPGLFHRIRPDQLHDVLVHEAAHILRRDHLVLLCQTLARIAFWPIVTVHLLNRALGCAREEVCDNYVLIGRDAVHYAETLLYLAQLYHHGSVATPSMGMFHWRGRLETRIAGLIYPRRNLMVRPRRFVAALILLGFGFMTAGVSATQLAAAPPEAAPQEEQPAPPAPQAADSSSPAKKQAKATAIYAMDADGGNVRELATIPDFPIINSPEISPDGRYVAVDGWRVGENLRDARLLLVDLKDKTVTNLGKGAMPTWSADGKWLAFCKYAPQRGVYIRSLDGKVERQIDPNGWGIQWSPDGLKAAYTRNGEFIVYDFIGDKKRTIAWNALKPYSFIYWNPTWSPDSKQICFKGQREDGVDEIGIISVTSDDPSLHIHCEANAFNPDIAWHPDGSRVTLPKRAQPGQPGQIYVFDPANTDAPRPLKGQPTDRNNSGMCWSRDGKTLIFLSRAR